MLLESHNLVINAWNEISDEAVEGMDGTYNFSKSIKINDNINNFRFF